MDKRVSKSFKSIFKNFYPNLDENECNKALDYFLFTLKKFPDKSNILQLKLFLYIFSFRLRALFIKNNNIKNFFSYLQKSNVLILRKLGVYMFVLMGHCISRSLDGEGIIYNKLSYPKYNNGTDFDGMDVHSSGYIFTAGPGGLLIISPEGELMARINSGQITNCTFNDDESYLYITGFLNNPKLFRIKLK